MELVQGHVGGRHPLHALQELRVPVEEMGEGHERWGPHVAGLGIQESWGTTGGKCVSEGIVKSKGLTL